MDENILRLRVGSLVLISIILLGIMIMLFSDGWSSQYEVIVKPQSAPHVLVGTPIRRNGILIGRVRDVQTEDDHVVLTLGINEDEAIYSNEVVSIGNESVLGDAGLKIMSLPRAERGQRILAGGSIARVSVERDPLDVIDTVFDLQKDISQTLEVVQTAATSVRNAGDGIRSLTDTVDGALNNENSQFKLLLADLRTASGKASRSLDSFNAIFENLNRIVGDPELKTKVNKAFDTLPEVFNEVRGTIADVRETINSFGGVSGRINDNLDNLSVFTEELKQQGPEIISQVNDSLKNIDGFLEEARTFGSLMTKLEAAIGGDDGTIGKLLNDSELYDNINSTVLNARDVTARVNEISTKLKPLMRDLRIFADKLARDPGDIGVPGILNRSRANPTYKGSEGNNGGIFRGF